MDAPTLSEACENTDRELWRGPDEGCGDYYADKIFVTKGGGIGIDCGGVVIVKPLRDWHGLARALMPAAPPSPESDTEDDIACMEAARAFGFAAPAPQEHPKEPRADGVTGCNCYPPHETTEEFDAAHPPQEQKQEADELVLVREVNELLREQSDAWRKLYNAAKRSRDDMALDVAHHAKQRAEAEKKLAEAEREIKSLESEMERLNGAHLSARSSLEQQVERLVKERDAAQANAEHAYQQFLGAGKERDALRVLLAGGERKLGELYT